MNYRLLLLLFTVTLCAAPRLEAQEDFDIDLGKTAANLQLDGYHIENLIEVLDDKTYIGFVQTGIGNTKTPARLGSGIRAGIAGFLSRSGSPTAETKPLTLRINKLYIHELTYSSSELSFVVLNVSFLEKKGTGWSELFQAAVSLNRNGMDVTHQHDDNIVSAFRQCFADFNDRMKQGKLRPREVPDSALWINPLTLREYYPVFAETSFPKAIYPSFYDFRDAFPDTTNDFSVSFKTARKDSLILCATIDLQDESDIRAPWGFSDGKQLYIRIGKKYYRIRERNGEFVSDVVPKDLSADIASGVMAAGIAGGIIGAALASGIAALAASSPGALERGNFRLDFSAKTLLPISMPDFMEIRSHCLFYLSRVSASGLSACLFVDGVFHAKLQPGEYYDLSLTSGSKEISVTFISQDGTRLTRIFYPRLFQTDVYLIRIKKGKSIIVGNTFGDVKRDILLDQGPDNTVYRSEGSIPPDSCP
jgi:hypothetical protein